MNQKDIDLLPFYQFVTDNVSVGVHAINEKGQTILYNDKMKEIEGFSFEDLSDKTIVELFQIEPQESTLLKVLQTGEKILNVKQTYWNHKGQEITTVNDTYPVYDGDRLIGAIELSRDITTLQKLAFHPNRKNGEPVTFSVITTASESMRTVIDTAKKAATARLPVLLIGEVGTNKDMLAEAIHYDLSPSNSIFYTLYCHNSDATLIQNFYDEVSNLQSCTIFCERIDLLSTTLQQQLLRLLSDDKFSNHLFLASIGEDPFDLITSGKLLKELYYFFASMIITVPPLRERKEDIEPFVTAYFNRHRIRFGSTVLGISEEVNDLFHEYDWPGNIKELEILLDEISSLISTEEWVTVEMLPIHFRKKVSEWGDGNQNIKQFLVNSERDLLSLDDYLHQAEEYYLRRVMNIYDGNVTKAANALSMSRQNLQYRLRKLKK